LKNVATEYRQINDRTLAATLFDETLTDRKGTITKPASW
jgi:hypothetical protein